MYLGYRMEKTLAQTPLPKHQIDHPTKFRNMPKFTAAATA